MVRGSFFCWLTAFCWVGNLSSCRWDLHTVVYVYYIYIQYNTVYMLYSLPGELTHVKLSRYNQVHGHHSKE